MHYAEVGIARAKDLVERGEGINRGLFYQEPDPEQSLAPFTLNQLAAAFGLLGVGLAAAGFAFAKEWIHCSVDIAIACNHIE